MVMAVAERRGKAVGKSEMKASTELSRRTNRLGHNLHSGEALERQRRWEASNSTVLLERWPDRARTREFSSQLRRSPMMRDLCVEGKQQDCAHRRRRTRELDD
jgi:hypothetical protein